MSGYRSQLAGMAVRDPRSSAELDAEAARHWHEGTEYMAIRQSHPALNWVDRAELERIGNKLYGQRARRGDQ